MAGLLARPADHARLGSGAQQGGVARPRRRRRTSRLPSRAPRASTGDGRGCDRAGRRSDTSRRRPSDRRRSCGHGAAMVAPAARSRSRTARTPREAGGRSRLDDDERASGQRQRALDRLYRRAAPSARRRRRTARRGRRPAHRPWPGRRSGAGLDARAPQAELPQADAEAEQLRIAIEEGDAMDRRPAPHRRPQHRAGPGAEIGDRPRLDPRVTRDGVEHGVERGRRRRQPHDGVGEALGVGEPAHRGGRGGRRDSAATAPRRRAAARRPGSSRSRRRWRPAARDRTAQPRSCPTGPAAGRRRAPTSSTQRPGGTGRAPAGHATRSLRRRRWPAASSRWPSPPRRLRSTT